MLIVNSNQWQCNELNRRKKAFPSREFVNCSMWYHFWIKVTFLSLFFEKIQNYSWISSRIFMFFPEACNFIKKETLAQVFSCEFCEITKNTFSYKTALVATSDKTNVVFIFYNMLEWTSYISTRFVWNYKIIRIPYHLFIGIPYCLRNEIESKDLLKRF